MKTFKGILLSAAGLMMCLVYLAGVVGFDIHTDHHEGRTYVVSLLSDTSCEKIHPDDICHCCEHHHHHDAHSDVNGPTCEGEGFCAEEDDCQDTADFLDITGDGFDAQHTHFEPAAGFAFYMVSPACDIIPGIPYASQLLRPGSFSPPRVLLSRICVLRV